MGLEEKKMPFNLFHKKNIQNKNNQPCLLKNNLNQEAPVQPQEEPQQEPAAPATGNNRGTTI